MNHKLIEVTAQQYAELFLNHRPGAQPHYTDLCRAGGNIVLIAAAEERGLLLDLPLCTRPVTKKWASVEWQYSAPETPGVNPLASWVYLQGYDSITQYVEDFGLLDW